MSALSSISTSYPGVCLQLDLGGINLSKKKKTKKQLGELGNFRIWGLTSECKLHVLINGIAKKH